MLLSNLLVARGVVNFAFLPHFYFFGSWQRPTNVVSWSEWMSSGGGFSGGGDTQLLPVVIGFIITV